MLIIGDLSKFNSQITDRVEVCFYNGKIVPCFNFNGNHWLVNEQKFDSGDIKEIIEEVCYINIIDHQINIEYLVTREIGQSRSDRPENARVSLIYVYNNVLHIWRPFMRDIFIALKKICEASGRQYLSVVKEINEQLGFRRDFDVKEILKKYSSSREFAGITTAGYIPLDSGYEVNYYALFALIKHIMISEDLTYNKDGQLGRYLFQLAIYDFVVRGMALDEVLSKYRLNH
jgi:hypothetical protein